MHSDLIYDFLRDREFLLDFFYRVKQHKNTIESINDLEKNERETQTGKRHNSNSSEEKVFEEFLCEEESEIEGKKTLQEACKRALD